MVCRNLCPHCGQAYVSHSYPAAGTDLHAVSVSPLWDDGSDKASEAVSWLGSDEAWLPKGKLVSLNTMPPHLSDKR